MAEREARRYLRAVEREASARDPVVGLLPYYTGLRDGEVVSLDVEDVRLSARKGELRVLGTGSDGGKQRTLPVPPTCGRRCRPGCRSVSAGRERTPARRSC